MYSIVLSFFLAYYYLNSPFFIMKASFTPALCVFITTQRVGLTSVFFTVHIYTMRYTNTCTIHEYMCTCVCITCAWLGFALLAIFEPQTT